MNTAITFPGLGIEWNPNRVAFTILGKKSIGTELSLPLVFFGSLVLSETSETIWNYK